MKIEDMYWSEIIEESELPMDLKRWVITNVPKKYRRAVLAIAIKMTTASSKASVINVEHVTRSISNLYKIDYVTLTNFVNKITMFFS